MPLPIAVAPSPSGALEGRHRVRRRQQRRTQEHLQQHTVCMWRFARHALLRDTSQHQSLRRARNEALECARPAENPVELPDDAAGACLHDAHFAARAEV